MSEGLGWVQIVMAAISGISAIVKTTKANKAARAQMRGSIAEYQAGIAQIRNENMALDAKIADTQNLLVSLRNGSVQQMNGLGFCLLNCETKQVTKDLSKTATEYNNLVTQQDQKLLLLDGLMRELEQYTDSSNVQKIGFIIAGSLVLLAGIYYISQ